MPSADNKRIAKNTIMLYIRMAVTMLVSLYTSRVVLEALGVDDFGIWSVVGTLVVMVSFITSPLASATQRFINVALGQKDEERAGRVFSQSLILYAIFAVGLLALFETAGLWFLTHKMDIPHGRMDAAIWVFHFVVASFIITILRVPFDAVVIANERFRFYAGIGIVDVLLKLGIVFMLPFAPDGKTLIFYAALMLCSNLIVAGSYIIFCTGNFENARPKLAWDKTLARELMSFTGWSTFGAFASVSSNQGLSIIVNLFFGVAVNAAMGLANQVANAVNQFVSNFQTAFQPQIVQRYAAGDKESMFHLVCVASKVSFILIMAIGVPVIFNIDFLLLLWLKEVPALTSDFCILIICVSIIEAAGAPLWMVIQATGKIRTYQIIISSLLLINVIISYILLYVGLSAPTVFIVKIGICIICLCYRIWAVRIQAKISLIQMLTGFVIPEISVCIISITIIILVKLMLPYCGLMLFFTTSASFFCALVISAWLFMANRRQRATLKIRFISKFLSK